MKNLNIFSKIFLTIAFLSGALWTGAYLSRMIISYQLFEGPDLLLKSSLNSTNLPAIFSVLNSSVVLTIILYIVFIFNFVIFLLSSKISLKQNGWLFIIALAIFITLPFELYLMTIDYKIVSLIFSNTYNSQQIVSLYVKRFKILGSFPLMEIFCYFSFFYFILFRPLQQKVKS
jgi:hypothetical protein